MPIPWETPRGVLQLVAMEDLVAGMKSGLSNSMSEMRDAAKNPRSSSSRRLAFHRSGASIRQTAAVTTPLPSSPENILTAETLPRGSARGPPACEFLPPSPPRSIR